MSVVIDTTLGELCESIDYGVTASADFANLTGPKLLRITDLKVDGVDWNRVPNCDISDADERHSLLRDGDIVVARTGGTVGKSFLIQTPPRSVNASYLLRVRPRVDRVLPEYLHQFFGSDAYWSQLLEVARGAAQPNVNATTLSAIELRVPPLSEQRRIAARLKAQLAAAEQAQRAAQAQWNDVRQLATAAIDAALAEVMEAEMACIGAVAKVQSGYAFKGSDFRKSGVRLLRNANVLPGRVYWDDAAYLAPEQAQGFERFALNAHDILISLDRPIISSGIKVARVTAGDLPALLVQRVGRFQMEMSRLLPDYLFAFLQSRRFIEAISGHDQSVGVPHISPGQVEGIELPLPSVEQQQRIVANLKQRLAAIEQMRQGIAAQLADIRQLPARLLAQAFHPTDEGTSA